MEQILSNLADPSWWFTGVFFCVIGLLLAATVKHVPLGLKKLYRNKKAIKLRKIKSLRTCQSVINYEIAKSNSYFILFVMVVCLFLFWFVSGPLNQIAKSSIIAVLILSSPIYVFEFLWLIQDKFTRDLIARSRKLRITSK
ncbi:hypothetical protein [Methylomonas sp. ZR1]|uniref:hypothetical protein n=1 Tax=Methylomonas sp. ZR1 TaxID=1797072 RepID=UPI001492BC24|nr:hypothetical protein [Methylomonas sp. ZR1]